jgi:RecB family endonuclease NucS
MREDRKAMIMTASFPARGSATVADVRLVLARCSVDYVGRLTAHLPPAVRLLMVKADGSVLVHSDTGGYKPLMWMTPPCTLLDVDGVWTVANRTGDQVVITVEEILHDSAHDLGTDPGLVKDGVEKHLQELLADRCEVLGTGLHAGAPRVPHRHRPRSTCSAVTRTARTSPSR